MKKLSKLVVDPSNDELRLTETGIEVWKKQTIVDINVIKQEKERCDKILQIINNLDNDYDLIVLLIKVFTHCTIVDNKGTPLSVGDIKFNLSKDMTDEWGARNYIITKYELEYPEIENKIPEIIIKEELDNG